jgi:hypothetical protein
MRPHEPAIFQPPRQTGQRGELLVRRPGTGTDAGSQSLNMCRARDAPEGRAAMSVTKVALQIYLSLPRIGTLTVGALVHRRAHLHSVVAVAASPRGPSAGTVQGSLAAAASSRAAGAGLGACHRRRNRPSEIARHFCYRPPLMRLRALGACAALLGACIPPEPEWAPSSTAASATTSRQIPNPERLQPPERRGRALRPRLRLHARSSASRSCRCSG